jgi:uncharacterized protein YndB with AHSA1/START domain
MCNRLVAVYRRGQVFATRWLRYYPGHMDAARTVRRSLDLPVSMEQLWEALTRPARLAAWFGADVIELELRPGGRIVFEGQDGSVRRGLVQVVDPPRRFVFRWLPIAVGSDGSSVPFPRATVEFVLAETDEGTHLTVTESTSPLGGEDAGTPQRVLLRA